MTQHQATATLHRGRYAARVAETTADLERAFSLRSACFRGGASDQDDFDVRCDHVLVEDADTRDLVCTFRLLPIRDGADIDQCYSASFYDLAKLAQFPGGKVEVGRFCISGVPRDADVLRVAWGALTRYVDALDVRMLFGCSSFSGVDPTPLADAFAYLRAGFLAPTEWSPGARAQEIVAFSGLPAGGPSSREAVLLPPLLRSYLAMGGRVSDHAVIDRDLRTCHVFTGVDIERIPPARAKALRLLAG